MGLLSRMGGLGSLAPQMPQPTPPVMAPGGGIGGGMGGEMGAMQGAFGGNPQFMAQLQALMQGQGPGGGIGGGMGGEMGAMQGAFGGNPQFMAQLQALMQGQGPGMAPPRFMGSGGLPPLQGPPAGKGAPPGAAGGFGSVDLQKLLRGY